MCKYFTLRLQWFAFSMALLSILSCIFPTCILADSKIKYKIIKTVDNTLWNTWLKKYVVGRSVDYQRGKKDYHLVKSYVDYLLSINYKVLRNREEQLAYLINLYNALIVKVTYKYYPIKSVMKLGKQLVQKYNWSFFDSKFSLLGQKISLNTLEKKIILAKFNQPLIHFAMNCASRSCPELRNSAYEGTSLKRALIVQTQKYLHLKEYMRVDHVAKKIYVISLFKWYAHDLGDPRLFYKQYTKLDIDLSKYQIEYIKYDWSLNDVK